MKMTKRECPVKIDLEVHAGYYLRVNFEINGEKHEFWPSAAVSLQFMDFMSAVYQLYIENEGIDCHNDALPFNKHYARGRRNIRGYGADPRLKEDEMSVETSLDWDDEGHVSTITLYRKVKKDQLYPVTDGPDPITITIEYKYFRHKSGTYTYVVDGKDLCYAIGKAGTEAIRKYGFHGYFFSTGWDDGVEDWIDMNQLLFFKAYSLNVMEVRDFIEVKAGDSTVYKTDYEKELELFLFEM